MNTILKPLFLTLTLSFLACAKEDHSPNSNPTPSPGDTVQLSKIEEILSGDNQSLIGLVNKVRGHVGKSGPASKTIWSRKNDHGLGLYIRANHVYGISGWRSKKCRIFRQHI